MSYYGYNRVSTKEQNLDRGNDNIKRYCNSKGINLEKIYVDKQTGTNFEREQYKIMKENALRKGDCLIIAEYDRLGRAEQTKLELQSLKEMGVRVIFLDIPTTQIDMDSFGNDEMATSIMSFINETLIAFYDCIARSEYARKKKRQEEGYEALKKRGEWYKLGRPRVMQQKEFDKQYIRVVNKELTTTELMRELKMKEDTYFRYVRKYRQTHQESNEVNE